MSQPANITAVQETSTEPSSTKCMANTHIHTHTDSRILSHLVYCTLLSEVLRLFKAKNKVCGSQPFGDITSMSPKLKNRDYPKYLIGGFILRKPWCLQHTRPHCISVKVIPSFLGLEAGLNFDGLVRQPPFTSVNELALYSHASICQCKTVHKNSYICVIKLLCRVKNC